MRLRSPTAQRSADRNGERRVRPPRRDLRPLQRLPLLALGFIGLFFGVAAGLARVGWSVPDLAASASSLHGPLMVGGFLGVVIALERAVALGRYWAYLGPLLAGLGGAAAIAGAMPIGAWLLLAGSSVLFAATADIFRRQRAVFTFTLVLGAACWALGNLLWITGSSVNEIVTWWLAFLILTIAAERLELSRFMPPSPIAKGMFVLILAAIVAGLLGTPRPWGSLVFAGGLLALSAWLGKQDIARRTIRSPGLTRFIAVCLLSGYVWLAVGGGVILGAGGLAVGAPSYDAAVHALALGFAFSMVFGHAPIIFPAVLRVAVPYHRTFYVPLALLHASLAVRVAGDMTAQYTWTRIGALLNAIALAAFIVSMVTAVVRGKRSAAVRQSDSGPGTDASTLAGPNSGPRR
jgi:hypothetical protein